MDRAYRLPDAVLIGAAVGEIVELRDALRENVLLDGRGQLEVAVTGQKLNAINSRLALELDDARRQARETRLEMEDWADGILSTLEVNLEKFLTAVKRGRERLHERSQETVVAGIGPREPEDDPSYL